MTNFGSPAAEQPEATPAGPTRERWPGRIDCPLCGVTQYAALPGHEGDPESHLTCDSCRRETQR
jgi:hypothetical protein